MLMNSSLNLVCKAWVLQYSPQQRDQLMAYLQLLISWNKAYNLTAIRDPQQMVALHLLDSLAVFPYLTG